MCSHCKCNSFYLHFPRIKQTLRLTDPLLIEILDLGHKLLTDVSEENFRSDLSFLHIPPRL